MRGELWEDALEAQRRTQAGVPWPPPPARPRWRERAAAPRSQELSRHNGKGVFAHREAAGFPGNWGTLTLTGSSEGHQVEKRTYYYLHMVWQTVYHDMGSMGRMG